MLMDDCWPCRPVPSAQLAGSDSPPDMHDLPDSVMEDMLKRELLLPNANLHGLGNEHITSERKLRSLRTQLRQVGTCAPAVTGSSAAGERILCSGGVGWWCMFLSSCMQAVVAMQ